MIVTKNNHGFFSGCTIKLYNIINYINQNKKLPEHIEDKYNFVRYKRKCDKRKSIVYHYFEHYENIKDIEIISPINFNPVPQEDQFSDYSKFNYSVVAPLIEKYFSPSEKINKIIKNIEEKYNFIYSNTLAVYYRGTDKKSETKISSFDEFYKKIEKIINFNENIEILVQSDTSQFIDFINNKSLKNITIITENRTLQTEKGIHNEQTRSQNYHDMFYFLSTIIVISKCKYIICSSGNVSFWIMMYRKENKNIIQYLNGKWFDSINI